MDKAQERPFHSVAHVVNEELKRLHQECLAMGEGFRESEAYRKGSELINSCDSEAVSDIVYMYFKFFEVYWEDL